MKTIDLSIKDVTKSNSFTKFLSDIVVKIGNNVVYDQKNIDASKEIYLEQLSTNDTDEITITITDTKMQGNPNVEVKTFPKTDWVTPSGIFQIENDTQSELIFRTNTQDIIEVDDFSLCIYWTCDAIF